MNTRAIAAIVQKDLLTVRRSKAVLLPLLIAPAALLLVAPAVIVLVAYLAPDILATGTNDLRDLLALFPQELQLRLARYNPAQQAVYLSLVHLLAPMFLIIPLVVAAVIAADSFAGEKERKTLEALLYTPTTDADLFIAKMLSAWTAATFVTLGGFVLYVTACNGLAWPVMREVFLPNAMWMVLIVWLAPSVACLGLGAAVAVSARVRTTQEAHQLAMLVILPLVMLVIGQVRGVLYFSPAFVVLLGLVFWILDALLLWYAIHTFKRDRLTQQI
jgi:ABC-2 type transport system permease protein